RPGLYLGMVNSLHGAFGGARPTFFTRLQEAVLVHYRSRWREHVHVLKGELLDRAALLYTRLILAELLSRTTVTDPQVVARLQEWKRLRAEPPALTRRSGHHHGARSNAAPPSIDPYPALD